MESAGKVLILVENLSVPFDQRVRREAWALRDAGYQVCVVCPRGKNQDTAAHEEVDGIHIYRYRSFEARAGLAAYLFEFSLALLMMSYLTFKVWLRHGFDVVQLCNPPDLLFLVAIPYKLLGKRVIFDHHDLSPEVFLSKSGKPPRGCVFRILCALERATFRTADVVMATNASYARVATHRGGVPPSAVYIVRNGPDLKRVVSRPPTPAWKAGKKHLIAYIGTLGKQDGGDVLLCMFHQLLKVRPPGDLQLVVMGGGPELSAMRRQVNELGISNDVTLTGRISDDEVMEALSTADICVSPDPPTPLNDVSTMNKTLEYMALGKPVVAFNLKETRVSAGGAALYAETRETFIQAMERLIDDPDLRHKLGRNGKDRIQKKLSWDHSVPFLLRAYRHALMAESQRAQRKHKHGTPRHVGHDR